MDLKTTRPGRSGRSIASRMARPAWQDEPEWMDGCRERRVLEENLRDLRRVNRTLGGTSLTLDAFKRLLGDRPPPTPVSVLDVGTGGADIPAALSRWCRQRGLAARIVATDLNPETLQLAERDPAVDLLAADALRLPFADGAFDVATCSLALHHFPPAQAVLVLREMRRVARLGVVVNDLLRTWAGLAGALILTRLFTRNALTRHDAPLSVRRAYTRRELGELAVAAGLQPVASSQRLFYRAAMVARPA